MKIQLTLQNQVQNEVQANDPSYQVIDKPTFLTNYSSKFNGQQDAEIFWDQLFGHRPQSVHLHFSHLTDASCKLIIEHKEKFCNGFDFDHLPKGFCLKEKDGKLCVLHYNRYLENSVSALAVNLDEKKDNASVDNFNGDDADEKNKFLSFFKGKIKGSVCTKSEIKNALIEFFKVIEQKNQEIAKAQNSGDIRKIEIKFPQSHALEGQDIDINPVVIIARMASIMQNPHLQPKNYQAQFEALLQLPLHDSRAVPREITDRQFSDFPLGIALPEHDFESQVEKKTNVFAPATLDDFAKSGSCYLTIGSKAENGSDNKEDFFKAVEKDFLKYIALHQPAASIDFYRKCFAQIKQMELHSSADLNRFDSYRGYKNPKSAYAQMYQMLARSTSGENFSATEEAYYEQTWASFCQAINNTPQDFSVALTLQRTNSETDKLGLKHEFIHHLGRLEQQPALPYVASIMDQVIEEAKAATSIPSILSSAVSGQNPLDKLEALSEKLNQSIKEFTTDYYHGAKFYFSAETRKWVEKQNFLTQPNDLGQTKLNIRTYTEFVYQFGTGGWQNRFVPSEMGAKFLVPLISHFDISDQNFNDIQQLNFNTINLDSLNFVSRHLRQMTKPSSFSKLNLLITQLDSLGVAGQTDVRSRYSQLLDIIKQTVGTECFGDNYFEQAKAALNQNHLTDEQKYEVQKLLGQQTTDNLLPILINIKTHDASYLGIDQANCFNGIAQQFSQLKGALKDANFDELANHLKEINALKFDEAKNILETLITQRSTGLVGQFMFCKSQLTGDPETFQKDLGQKLNNFINILCPEQDNNQDPTWKAFPDEVHIKETIAHLCLYGHSPEEIKDWVGELSGLVVNFSMSHTHLLNTIQNCLKQSLRVDELIQNMQTVSSSLSTNKNKKKIFFSLTYALSEHPEKWQTLVEVLDQLTDQKQKKALNQIDYYEQEDHIDLQMVAGDYSSSLLQYIGQLLDEKRITFGGEQDLLEQLSVIELTGPDASDLLFGRALDIDDDSEDERLPFLKTFLSIAKTPPYPSIKTLKRWHEDNKDIAEAYKTFCKQPYERNPSNQYNNDDYSRLLKGFDPSSQQLFQASGDQSFSSLTRHIEQFRSLEYQALRDKSTCTGVERLAYLIEMLARNAHQGEDQAQELNSTQVMALFAMTQTQDQKWIAQMDAGEGKSRVIMLYALWCALEGRTVDLLTSNQQLSERDYLKYSGLAAAVGVPTSLITLHSDPQMYQLDGINFSDNNSLALLRTKAHYEKTNNFLNKDRKKRQLIGDEFDTFIHDKVQDSYNYAELNQQTAQFQWIYQHLVKFNDQKTEQLSLPSTLSDDFCLYIKNNEPDSHHKERFDKLKEQNPDQIKSWLEATKIAREMEPGKHYHISKEKHLVRTERGTEYKRVIEVIENGRIRPGFIFQNGMHAILAHIEMARDNAKDIHVEPESDTKATQHVTQFIANYNHIAGLTGTTAHEIFNHPNIKDSEDISYITVPRQAVNQRVDHAPIVKRDSKAQFAEIKRFVTEQYSKQPILIFCEDDNQVKALQNLLNTLGKSVKSRLQTVFASSSSNEEELAIGKAGQKNTITIATAGKMGRGTDIDNPKKNLQVLVTYLPSERDQKQIASRTARFGKQGDCHYILDQTKINDLTSSHQYQNKLMQITRRLDKQAYLKNEATHIFSWVKHHVLQKVSSEGANTSAMIKVLEQKTDDAVEKIQTSIKNEEKVSAYIFDALIQEVAASYNKSTETDIHLDLTLSEKFSIIFDIQQHQKRLQKLSSSFPNKKLPKYITADRYERGHDGQAVVYTRWFEKWRATLAGERDWFADFRAWRHGTGFLNPNWTAWWRGERAFFATYLASEKRAKKEGIATLRGCLLEMLILLPTCCLFLIPNIVPVLWSMIPIWSVVSAASILPMLNSLLIKNRVSRTWVNIAMQLSILWGTNHLISLQGIAILDWPILLGMSLLVVSVYTAAYCISKQEKIKKAPDVTEQKQEDKLLESKVFSVKKRLNLDISSGFHDAIGEIHLEKNRDTIKIYCN
ncbi:hypothetical protein N9Y17_00775 [Gammaproteobacteria bacterium]|nr:hypothetical protein [Gammaproteobacteria bacterium]